MDRTFLDNVLTESFADRRISRSERRALREVVADLADDARARSYLRQRAVEIASAAVPSAHHDVVEWLDDVLTLVAAGAPSANRSSPKCFFTPGEDCLRAILDLIKTTRHSADICVFTITDNRITREIEAAYTRGVTIRTITDNDKIYDAGSDIIQMARRGLPIRIDTTDFHMHHKFAIFDRRTTITGSYNWTRGAATGNHENIMVSDDESLRSAFQNEFDRLWAELPKYRH